MTDIENNIVSILVESVVGTKSQYHTVVTVEMIKYKESKWVHHSISWNVFAQKMIIDKMSNHMKSVWFLTRLLIIFSIFDICFKLL